MKTKIEIKSIFGKVLFELEKEDNSIKETLKEAVNSEVDLRGAYLREVDLREVDLRGADLREAYLRGVDLREADLREADLRGAKEINIEKLKSYFWLTPEEGSFVAWKKAANNCVCKLEIPSEAKRISNSKNRKCRAEFVKTLLILDSEQQQLTQVCGNRDSNTIYKVGELTYPDKFDDDIFEDCSHGIHFFMTKQEAIDWNN